MCANWSRYSGRASAFAPASMRTVGPARAGITTAIAGRRTPGRRRMCRSDAASIAPVLPAETTASASPSATARTARTSEESGLARTASTGWSSISMRSRGLDEPADRACRGLEPRRGPARSRRTPRQRHRRRSRPVRGRRPARRRRRGSCAEYLHESAMAPGCGAARRRGPGTSCSSGTCDAGASAACSSGRPAPAAWRSRAARGACRASPSTFFASGRP